MKITNNNSIINQKGETYDNNKNSKDKSHSSQETLIKNSNQKEAGTSSKDLVSEMSETEDDDIKLWDQSK